MGFLRSPSITQLINTEATQTSSIDLIQTTINGDADSSAITSDRDGSVMERQEFIINSLLTQQPVNIKESISEMAIIGNYSYFHVFLTDIDSVAFAATDIDITSATCVMEKSTGGGAFSDSGITQPTLAKGLGTLSIPMLFLGTDWANNDVYRLTVSGVSVTVNAEPVALQTFIWLNVVSASTADILTETDKIPATILKIDGIKTETDKIAGEVVKTTAIQAMTDRIGVILNTGGTATLANVLGDMATVTIADSLSGIKTETDKLPTAITNIDGIKTETDKIPATIIKIDAIKLETDKIGVLLNTGGTASLGDIIGDVATVTIADSLAAIKTETDKITATKETIDSIDAAVEIISDHNHSVQKVYPTLANGITVTGGVDVWTLGNKIEVVPANTITAIFDIHYVNIGVTSATDTYEVVFYSGAEGAEVEIGRCRVTRTSNQSGAAPTPLQTPLIPANTRISASCATATSGADTIVLSVFYHTY